MRPPIDESASNVVPEPIAALPDWPSNTIAMLSTVDEGPHGIPVTAPLRAGDHRIMFTLKHDRG
jgi:hypothetical protein